MSSSSSRLITPLLTIPTHRTRPLRILTHLHHLHTTPPARRETWRRSPKVKDAERDRRRQPAGQQQQRGPPQVWPTEVLDAAYEAGGLPVNSVFAVAVLETFERLTRYNRPGKSAVRKLCDGEKNTRELIHELDHNIQPMTLTILAQILLKAGNTAHFPLVRELLLAASELDDEAATITLVSQAVQTSRMRHPDIVAPRAHLARLAAAGNPAAMVLQAELLAASGHTHKALLLCEEAVRKDGTAYTGAEAIGATKTKAWSTLAKLRMQDGDADGARVALEQGALEHDDPWAFYYLANTYRSPAHPEYLLFMLKAAAAGIPEAANKLGRYYLGLAPASSSRAVSTERGGSIGRGATAFAMRHSERDKRLLALEWFSVSVEHPTFRDQDEAQVFLALLLRGQGELEKGRAVLQRAMASEVYGPNAVPWFAERWYGTRDFLAGEFLRGEMERVILGEMEEGG
ncbi:hypothetical protein MMC15_000392 [Xylographa vitiligo]|nr:hypothetical protein [Xylographa vitiligo]